MIHDFLDSFQVLRIQNLELPEDDRDPVLVEFGRLMQQGTNDLNSLSGRVNTLTRYFLQDNPDIQIRDAQRAFSEEERIAIWILCGKKCSECGKDLELDEMQADHQQQWAHGGPTTLENGQSLCASCNAAKNKSIS
ncbi:HNH endonuclease [Chloroflexota bacterium]